MRICKEGWPFIGGALAAALLFCLLAVAVGSPFLGFLGGLSLVAAAFCAYFFRDPRRHIPAGDDLILSPADGRILEIVESRDESFPDPAWVIRIFLSVFDPHLQRSPVRGVVRAVRYTAGKFLDARDPKAPFENERNRIEIQPFKFPAPIVVTQIAGLIARRIVCDVAEGQSLFAGSRLGLIRFGSQVDVALPKSVRIKVRAGDYVKAGEAVLAEVGRS
ncbi:MAG TPA: phosphatidylserine decarboxylase [Elusimicrobiota bacterium]|nr:phosphatidylserine decarboxylase [Elusimicrobiota bacterium]